MPRLYDPLLVMVYADKAVQALLKGDLVNVIVNQNNTTECTTCSWYFLFLNRCAVFISTLFNKLCNLVSCTTGNSDKHVYEWLVKNERKQHAFAVHAYSKF